MEEKELEYAYTFPYKIMNERDYIIQTLRLAFSHPKLTTEIVSEALDLPIEIAIKIMSITFSSSLFGYGENKRNTHH